MSLEAREKLNNINPVNLGQALRISGVNLNDIMKVQIYLKGMNNERRWIFTRIKKNKYKYIRWTN